MGHVQMVSRRPVSGAGAAAFQSRAQRASRGSCSLSGGLSTVCVWPPFLLFSSARETWRLFPLACYLNFFSGWFPRHVSSRGLHPLNIESTFLFAQWVLSVSWDLPHMFAFGRSSLRSWAGARPAPHLGDKPQGLSWIRFPHQPSRPGVPGLVVCTDQPGQQNP